MLEILISDDGSPTIFNTVIRESYHSRFGARSESEHVFIQNGLETVLPKANNVNILEIGFGSGLNALLTQQAVGRYQAHIRYDSLEPFPISPDLACSYIRNAHFSPAEQQDLLKLHQAPFGQNQQLSPYFTLHKTVTGIQEFQSDIMFSLVYFDAFSPDKAPELWTEAIFRKLYQMMITGGILVTYCAKGFVKRHLKAAGFTVEALKGAAGKREMVRAGKL